MLIAVWVLFAPMAMNRAMAATPATSHSQMMGEQHCQPASDDGRDDSTPESCCTAACAATALAPTVVATTVLPDRLPDFAALAGLPRGVLGEIDTPPPRPE